MSHNQSDLENIRFVYQQDCESMRHQDSLRWSRYQYISIVEGVLIAALSQGNIETAYKFSIVLLCALLVLLLSLLSFKDGKDAENYSTRLRELEKVMGISPLSPTAWPLGRIRGRHLHFVALTLLNCFNLLILIIMCSMLIKK